MSDATYETDIPVQLHRASRALMSSARTAAGLTVLPLGVLAVALIAVSGSIHPWGDIALIEMRTRDVGHHAVLLGPFSRMGWHHPGPAIYYLLAVPYRLLGGAPLGLYLGAIAINVGAVAGMVALARRRGGMALALVTAVALGLLLRSLGPELWSDPWNPSVTILPFGLFLFVTAELMAGRPWALPVAVGLASFLIQSHAAYLVLTVPLLGLGGLWWAVAAYRQAAAARPGGAGDDASNDAATVEPRAADVPHPHPHPHSHPRRRYVSRIVAATSGVVVLFWLLPLIEQLTNDPGNLTLLYDYAREGDEGARAWGDVGHLLGGQLAWLPEWVAGAGVVAVSREPAVLHSGATLPILLVPLAVAAGVVWRRGGPAGQRLVVLTGAAGLVAAAAILRTTGIAYAYLFGWVQVVGMLTGVVMGWGLWLAVRPYLSGEGLRRRLAFAATAALVGLAAVNSFSAVRAGVPEASGAAAVEALADGVDGHFGDDDPGLVVVAPSASFESMMLATGTVMRLEHLGVPARLMPYSEAAADWRVLAEDEVASATVVLVADEDIHESLDDPGLELLAMWGDPPAPRSPDDPVLRGEEAFIQNDVARMSRLSSDYWDHDLEEAFTLHAAAVFLSVDG